MGRALLHRNYRLFFFGQGISLIGTWLTRVATSWLVYRLTDSALMLGLVGFVGQIPTFLLAPFGGVLVDRSSRHRMLVVTQVLAMVQSALLAFFSLTHTITVAHVLVLSAFQGIINAFDTPARQAFVVEMVEDRADLANAIALNSSMVNAARLLGPSVAGVLIAAVGEGTCFLIDAISYLAVLASLLMMRLRPAAPAAARSRILADLGEGLRYVASFAPVRAILLLLALVSLAGVPYTVLMPIFAARVLGGGPHSLGLLMGASGIGAVAGALLLASRRSVLGLGRMLVIAGALFGAGLVAFSFSKWLPVSIVLMVVVGGGMMVQMAASNTLLQTLVDEDKRGRVMSFYTMAFFGMAPFGSLSAGWLGARVGAPMTVRLGGFVTLVGVAIFLRKLPALRRAARPIYVRLGILPEIASGLGQTTNKQ
ncbi:MFS transporter [Polyangium jinanense]|uniref:MFS transporter n=1 Tax=Polyangium jinanense TaxID=2829994 RepID=A0A9X3WXA2_9BACT|nr:MFS transporter [Polyangium jinanense]MDC3957839.1 MFS transporter [Polyangium jinanense]MDC3978925.1 MFS transporter [Polyangium jinanense]MDC3982096.1 MFS transporter [Polyangium jinanense]